MCNKKQQHTSLCGSMTVAPKSHTNNGCTPSSPSRGKMPGPQPPPLTQATYAVAWSSCCFIAASMTISLASRSMVWELWNSSRGGGSWGAVSPSHTGTITCAGATTSCSSSPRAVIISFLVALRDAFLLVGAVGGGWYNVTRGWLRCMCALCGFDGDAHELMPMRAPWSPHTLFVIFDLLLRGGCWSDAAHKRVAHRLCACTWWTLRGAMVHHHEKTRVYAGDHQRM